MRKPSAWGQLLKIVGIAMAVVLVSGVSVAAYVFNDLSKPFTDNAVDIAGQESVPPDIGAIEGGVNMLLVGSDECEEGYEESFGERCTEDEGGARNDVNMLLHISDNPRRVTVVTFPRDLMVPRPECTDENGNETSASSKAQINLALDTGGLNCVVQTVSELSGLDIQFAAKVTWQGVIDITNSIGGVPVCIANGLSDPYTGLDLPAGVVNLAGWNALQFLRTRHGIGDGSDLGRISNQQVYMSALARKLVSEEVLTNPATLLSLARTALENVTPSKSLTNPVLLVQIALAMKNVPYEDINFLQYPVFTDPDDIDRVVPDYDSADILWAALEANQQLQVTGHSDGAVNPDGSPIETPVDTTPGDGETVDPSTPPTTPGVVTLPDGVKGQSAKDETCSNGVGN
nr:LCP family protein [Microbacterium pseudoresistens]